MLTEKQLESQLIKNLTSEENQWEYRHDLKTEEDLWDNLKKHINRMNLAKLNGKLLTEREFELVKVEFRNLTATPFKASQWLRGENGIASITIDRDDLSEGKVILELFNNKDIGGGLSSYEIVNQVRPETVEGGEHGDVTLLINGLPIIHIELKTEVAKNGYFQAFDQIARYAESGYFNGIHATIQVFVVSNKVETKYFARPMGNTKKSFDDMREFLFNWRDENNNPVEDLFSFAKIVLRIPNAHELVSRFSILVDDKRNERFLMTLRPYQIHAIRKIREQAAKHEGGFIWHATGSGKTITSFVATKLLAQEAVGVDRTIMVVDRTDLDSQTKNEFGKFASEYHTGQASGEVVENTLIVGIENQRHLVKSLLSKKNNNTIIVTTIQKMTVAIRKAREEDKENGTNKLEKLKGEHIVFIVDEAHRAVSDEQMQNIQTFFPNSTWFGLTGTPILEENQKQEQGTYARTTEQQYGPLLHAYTTKNAMDDKSVLGFQIEYYSLMNEESENTLYYRKIKEKYPTVDVGEKFKQMTILERESLLDRKIYEREEHIKAILEKIFNRQHIIDKFRVVDGFPTMSAILTTHSIAQARKIYKQLMEMKKEKNLLNGVFLDERKTLIDEDFPRVTITYSLSQEQDEIKQSKEEFTSIIKDYNEMFKTNESVDDIDKFNRNVNSRLARKDKQYREKGQWLDLVIVVDRLLTGFDAPTIQTLYVDRELQYQKLLQAFSRTNRTFTGKEVGMIVTFRKPSTMRQNVEDTIKLYSNEEQNWIELVPKEYKEVRKQFIEVRNEYLEAKQLLIGDPNNLKKKIAQVKSFQQLEKIGQALKSYDDFASDEDILSQIESVRKDTGICENLKVEIRQSVKDQEGSEAVEDLLKDIEYTSRTKATHQEMVDSFYIHSLFQSYFGGEKEKKVEIELEMTKKPTPVQEAYQHMIKMGEENNISETVDARQLQGKIFTDKMNQIIEETAKRLYVSAEYLKYSFENYQEKKFEKTT